MEKTNKFNEFSMLRAIGALSVITIHVSAVFTGFNNTSFSYLSFGILNKFCNFAVPLFLFLSILLLTINAQKKDTLNVLNFYKKRFLKSVPAFLLYVFIYYFYLKYRNIEVISIKNEPYNFFTNYVLQGSVYYHLYFMPIIFQLYILFPIIYFFTKKIHDLKLKIHPAIRFILTFGILILLQFGFKQIHKYYIWPYYQKPAIFLFTYLIPIGMGMWIGFNYENFKNSKVMKIIALIIASISGYLFIRYTLFPTKILNGLILPIYTASVSIVLLSISIIIVNKANRLKALLYEISKYSLTIYLIHPLILDIFNRNILPAYTNFSNNVIFAIAQFVTILSTSYLIGFIFDFMKKAIKKLL